MSAVRTSPFVHGRTVIVWGNCDRAAIMRDFYARMERFELSR